MKGTVLARTSNASVVVMSLSRRRASPGRTALYRTEAPRRTPSTPTGAS